MAYRIKVALRATTIFPGVQGRFLCTRHHRGPLNDPSSERLFLPGGRVKDNEGKDLSCFFNHPAQAGEYIASLFVRAERWRRESGRQAGVRETIEEFLHDGLFTASQCERFTQALTEEPHRIRALNAIKVTSTRDDGTDYAQLYDTETVILPSVVNLPADLLDHLTQLDQMGDPRLAFLSQEEIHQRLSVRARRISPDVERILVRLDQIVPRSLYPIEDPAP